jgi:hypothetical protein
MRLTVMRMSDTYVVPSATILTISNPDYLDKPLKNNGEPCDLPEDAVVKFMVKRRATAAEYFYEYHQISLARTKLGWVSAE